MTQSCPHCAAMLWPSELRGRRSSVRRWGFCCENGKVQIEVLDAPPEPLQSLLLGNDERSVRFRRNIRGYNCALQFASSTIDVGEAMWGAHNVRIHGSLYHVIGPLRPAPGQPAKFAQMYVFDTVAQQADARRLWFDELDYDVMVALLDMLDRQNTVVQGIRHAFEIDNEAAAAAACEAAGPVLADVAPVCEGHIGGPERPSVTMEIVPDVPGSDRHTYNAPVVPSIAAVIPDTVQVQTPWRNIVYHMNGKDGKRSTVCISDANPAYDTLHFPLLHPRGEKGWQQGMPYNKEDEAEEGEEESGSDSDKDDGLVENNAMAVDGPDAAVASAAVGDGDAPMEAAPEPAAEEEEAPVIAQLAEEDALLAAGDNPHSRNAISALEFAKYRLMLRQGHDFLQRCSRLFEEYIIDQYVKATHARGA
eukprot:m51a1_g13113 hypothetical protein (420) ;mRNA; r:97-1907